MPNPSPSSQYVSRGPLRLHHLDWGNEGRHPIVLVHGSRLHAHVWNDFGRRFSDRYHVIAVDQRGHGDSAWSPEDGYALEELYRDLRAVVEARGLSRYTLIGHSLGGRVSMLYASRHQAEIDRLVLVDITPGRATSASTVRRDTPPEAATHREFETEDDAIRYLSRAMSRAPKALLEESVRHGLRKNEAGKYVWKYDPVLFTRRVPLPPGVDLWSLVGGIETPTLLQWGSESDVVNADLAARLGQTMPRCTVERVEGAGHGLFTDKPDEFAASVERFIETTGGAR